MNISDNQEVQSVERCLSPLPRNVPPVVTMSVISADAEANHLNFRSSSMNNSPDIGRKYKRTDNYQSAARGLHELENDSRNVETTGSDSSSTREKNPVDQDTVHINHAGIVEVQDEEKVEAVQHEEKQYKKRKRTLMNETQIVLAEKALADEPDMQRNASSLKLWAHRLSAHGPEVSSSQLKNWLNNRKARLARAAKDGRVHSESDNPDKQAESPISPIDDINAASTARGCGESGVGDPTIRASSTENSVTPPLASSQFTASGVVRCEPGQSVLLVNEKVEEVGRGKVYQVHGQWYGRNLGELRTCVIDITDLKVERFAKIPYPSEITGTSFDHAEKRLGSMRVLWDSNKLFVLPPQ